MIPSPQRFGFVYFIALDEGIQVLKIRGKCTGLYIFYASGIFQVLSFNFDAFVFCGHFRVLGLIVLDFSMQSNGGPLIP